MGITLKDVQCAVKKLEKSNKTVTVRAVRKALGDTGGLNTINKYLRIINGDDTDSLYNKTVTLKQYKVLEQRVDLLEKMLQETMTTIEALKVNKTDVKPITDVNDLEQFSNIVKNVVNNMEGDHGPKVFIYHAWIESKPLLKRMTLTNFKQSLLKAHRKRLLTLAREDMPSRHSAKNINQSRITYLNSEYHYVRQGS